MDESEKILIKVKKRLPEKEKNTIDKLKELNKKLREVKGLGDKISLYRNIEKQTQQLNKKIVKLKGVPIGDKEYLKSLLNKYCNISKKIIK